jgi:hypothetical protein
MRTSACNVKQMRTVGHTCLHAATAKDLQKRLIELDFTSCSCTAGGVIIGMVSATLPWTVLIQKT